MRTNYWNTLLTAAFIIAMSSCRSDTPHTTDTALATMSNSESDRVYYIERAADKFAGDLVLHLGLEQDVQAASPRTIKINQLVTNADPSPSHIGPFIIEHARTIEKEAWDLHKLILEWIFEVEE